MSDGSNGSEDIEGYEGFRVDYSRALHWAAIRSGLPERARHVVHVIASLMSKDGGSSRPSYKFLSDATDIPLRTINRLIPILEEWEKLTIRKGKGRAANSYTANISKEEALEEWCKKKRAERSEDDVVMPQDGTTKTVEVPQLGTTKGDQPVCSAKNGHLAGDGDDFIVPSDPVVVPNDPVVVPSCGTQLLGFKKDSGVKGEVGVSLPARARNEPPSPSLTWKPKYVLNEDGCQQLRDKYGLTLSDNKIRRAVAKHNTYLATERGRQRQKNFGFNIAIYSPENALGYEASLINWLVNDDEHAEKEAKEDRKGVKKNNPVLQQLLEHVAANPSPVDDQIDFEKAYFAELPNFDGTETLVKKIRNEKRGAAHERRISEIFKSKTISEWEKFISRNADEYPGSIGYDVEGNEIAAELRLSRSEYVWRVKDRIEKDLEKQRMVEYSRRNKTAPSLPQPSLMFSWELEQITEQDRERLHEIVEPFFEYKLGLARNSNILPYIHEIIAEAETMTAERLLQFDDAVKFYYAAEGVFRGNERRVLEKHV